MSRGFQRYCRDKSLQRNEVKPLHIPKPGTNDYKFIHIHNMMMQRTGFRRSRELLTGIIGLDEQEQKKLFLLIQALRTKIHDYFL